MAAGLLGDIAWSLAMAALGAVVAVAATRARSTARRPVAADPEARSDAAQALLSGLFEHAPAFISVLDRDLRVVMANKATSRMYGDDVDIVGQVGEQYRAFWPDVDALTKIAFEVMDSGESRRISTPFGAAGGTSIRQLDGIAFPLRGRTGEIDQLGLFLIDATERHDAVRALAEREAQLTSLFEHVPAHISVFDRNQRAVMVNRSATAVYGREGMDPLKIDLSAFREFWPEFDKILAMGASVFEAGESTRFRTRFKPNEDAAELDFDGMLFPIRSRSGEVEQVGLFLLDVTQQRQAEAALAEQQANLLAFFDYAPLQVYVTDLDHKIVMVNDWVFRETGAQVFHPSNVVGLSADKMVPNQWAEMSRGNDTTVVGRRGVTQVEVRGQFGGKERDIISIRFPIRDADGEVVRIGGFVVDVSKQKDAERALQERLAQSHQSEKLAALGQLLAGVAHELNNPLTVVVGRSAILEEKLAGTPHEKAIHGLREAADRCNRIVKTFLAMARQSAPRRGRVQLNDTIEAALDMTAYGMRSAGIRVDCRLAPDLPQVEADEDQLVQVFTNLLLNAQHALEDHDGPRNLSLTTHASEDRVVVVVADSGPGVPPELATRIFEPFFTTKEVGQGTGMGLAMSRGMIEEHGGALAYSSAPGGGALFEITLPIPESAAQPAAPAAPEALGPSRARGRVLVVDDEEPIRAMLGEILSAMELEWVEAANGAAALEQLEAATFDLIICDVRMPGMDGISLRRELAGRRPELLERLVFTSGDVLQRDQARFAEIRDHTFIEKPFIPSEVRRVAVEILGLAGDAQ